MGEPALLIETSGRAGRVGLAVNGGLLERGLDPARRHARDLVPAVRELLAVAGLTPTSIRRVAVSVGPGSFTGLRVGIMSATAFAYAAGCGVVAVPTFAAIAEMCGDTSIHAVEVVADGLQGAIYAERFERAAGGWLSGRPLSLLQADVWAGTQDCRGVIGPGAELVRPLLQTVLLLKPVAAPSLAAMLSVSRRLPDLEPSSAMTLEPLYLRGSSAEERAARAAG
jgi:tRNA threonylcarbamoyladenosine biosynthesis protein TsaB